MAVGIPLGVDGHAAVDVDIVGVLPQAGHVGVEAHTKVYVIRARLEEQCVALGTEVVRLHLREDVVHRFFHAGGGHSWVKHEDVRAEDGGIGLGWRSAEGDCRDLGANGSRGE